MKIINGKASSKQNLADQSGIGISNVRQRLDLLYKEKYDLQIREDEEVFVVDLRLELIKIENKIQADALAETRSKVAYV